MQIPSFYHSWHYGSIAVKITCQIEFQSINVVIFPFRYTKKNLQERQNSKAQQRANA